MTSVLFYIDTDEQCLEQCDQTEGCVGAVHDSNYPDVYVLYSNQQCGPAGPGPGPGPVELIPAPVTERHAFVLVQSSSTVSRSSSALYPSSTTFGSPNLLQTVSCPSSDHTTYTDPTNQRSYEVRCGSILSSPSTYRFTQFRTVHGKYSFAACAALCNSTNCPAFVYSVTSSACGLYDAAVDGAATAVPNTAPTMTLARALSGLSSAIASSRILPQTSTSPIGRSSITAAPSSQSISLETSSTSAFDSASTDFSTTSARSKSFSWPASTSSSPVSTQAVSALHPMVPRLPIGLGQDTG